LPGINRFDKSLLYDIFCRFEILSTKDFGQQGNQLSRFLPEKLVRKIVDGNIRVQPSLIFHTEAPDLVDQLIYRLVDWLDDNDNLPTYVQST
jgi:hypothetical protein